MHWAMTLPEHPAELRRFATASTIRSSPAPRIHTSGRFLTRWNPSPKLLAIVAAWCRRNAPPFLRLTVHGLFSQGDAYPPVFIRRISNDGGMSIPHVPHYSLPPNTKHPPLIINTAGSF